MGEDLVAWLRVQVEARLGLAREACEGTDGHWWRGATDWGGGGEPEPAGPLYGGERYVDEDGDLLGGEDTVVYDEGYPTDAQFGHMEANDPRDVIARCESELAILSEHATKINRSPSSLRPDDYWCQVCDVPGDVPGKTWCRTVRLIGKSYGRRDGYREEWAP